MSTLKVHVPPVPGRYQPATRRPAVVSDLRMSLRPLLLATLLLALSAAPAEAASRLTVRGAGFGHGVGMSQYGALGFAQHGATLPRHPRSLLHGYPDLEARRRRAEVRVLLQSGGSSMKVHGRRERRRRACARRRRDLPRRVRRAGRRGAALGGRREVIGRYQAPLRLAGAGGAFKLLGRAGNGVRDGALPRRARDQPGAVRAHGRQRARPRELHPGRRRRRDPADVAGRGAQGAGRRGADLRARDAQAVTGFDHYADTRSQVYNGVSGEQPTTDAAIAAHRGRGRHVPAASRSPPTSSRRPAAGPRTWRTRSSARPRSRGCAASRTPTTTCPRGTAGGPTAGRLSTVRRKLGSLVKGSFRSIRVTQRGASPRVVDATIVGTGGTTKITGPQLRSRLGLFDTWVYFNQMSTNVAPAPTTTPTPTPGPGPDDDRRRHRAAGARLVAEAARGAARRASHPSPPTAGSRCSAGRATRGSTSCRRRSARAAATPPAWRGRARTGSSRARTRPTSACA